MKVSLRRPAQLQPLVLAEVALILGLFWLLDPPRLPANYYRFVLVGVAWLAFGVSWLLTPRLRDTATRRGWLDMPAERRVHQTPTPRIGGLGMFISFGVAVLAVVVVGLFVPGFWLIEDLWRIGLLLAGAVIITTVMLIDDLRGLEPLTKLAWQFLAAAIVVVPQLLAEPGNPNGQPVGVLIDSILGLRITSGPLLWLICLPFTFFWIMGMINTVNLTDGLDGLAGGIVFIGAIILFLDTLFQNRGPFQFTSSFLSLALAAAVGGFLIFNRHPASIFMGDCGSYFLGYALAVISIIDGAKLATALLIIGFPILDEAFVYLNRIRRGKSPLRADRTHIHHRLLDMGWTPRQIVWLFYGLTISFGIVGVLPFQDKLWKFVSLAVLAAVLLPLLVYSVRHQPPTPPPAEGPPALAEPEELTPRQ